MKHLYGLPYSPWSEKAQWALEHHGHKFKYHEYVPMLGEPLLRAKTKNFTKPLSVPLLIDGAEVIMESFLIAQHADKTGEAETLFPDDLKTQIEHFNQIGEKALEAGRMRVSRKIFEDPKAQADALPSFFPRIVRKPLAPIAKIGAAFINNKYKKKEDDIEHLISALNALRKALTRQGDFVLGRFTYADMAMAVVLQLVEPVDPTYIRLGDHERRCWQDTDLAKEYSDLVEWRDELYKKKRPRISQTIF